MSGLWRKLDEKDENKFRKAARELDISEGIKIDNLWHPVYRAEVAKMIMEAAEKEI